MNQEAAEQWREIPGTKYLVSSEGRIESRWFKKPKILKLCLNSHGYVRMGMSEGRAMRTRLVHQLVAEAFLDPRPTPKHEVNHKNGLKSDPRAVNLEWVTRSENAQHRYDVLKHGAPHGENNGQSKLVEADVREMRRRRATGETCKAIAASYGIGRSNVSHIVNRRTWAWLT